MEERKTLMANSEEWKSFINSNFLKRFNLCVCVCVCVCVVCVCVPKNFCQSFLTYTVNNTCVVNASPKTIAS